MLFEKFSPNLKRSPKNRISFDLLELLCYNKNKRKNPKKPTTQGTTKSQKMEPEQPAEISSLPNHTANICEDH